MREILSKYLNSRIYWSMMIFALVVLPLVIFGSPGFYGDDLHFFNAIEKDGAIQGIASWLKIYGIFYRPIGISLLYLLYIISGKSSHIQYLFSIGIYCSVSTLLIFKLDKITKNFFLTLFIVIFFSSFVLNATAFWQLSSQAMVFACIPFIFLLDLVFTKAASFTKKDVWLWSGLWLLVLLTYEQFTGLLLVLMFIIWWENRKEGAWKALKVSLLPSMALSLVTLFFVAVYLSAANNPKIVSLHKLNKNSIAKEVALENNSAPSATVNSADNSSNYLKVDNENKDIAKKRSENPFLNRGLIFFKKINQVLVLFKENNKYSFNLIHASSLGKYFVYLLLLVACVSVIFLRIPLINRASMFLIFVMGLIWVPLTLAPFALYRDVHVPPYVFVLPSIGIGMILIGLLGIIFTYKFSIIQSYVLKGSLALIMFFSFIQQYGYYFALKEELVFWDLASKSINSKLVNLASGSEIILNDSPKIKNQHFFWLYKAIGTRYFLDQLGDYKTDVEVSYSSEEGLIAIRPNKFNGNSIHESYIKIN